MLSFIPVHMRKYFIVGIVVLLLLLADTVLWTLSQQANMPTGARILVNTGKTLVKVGFAALVVLGLIAFGRAVWSGLAGFLQSPAHAGQEEDQAEAVQHVVENNLRGIEAALSRLDADRASAMERIRQAQALSNQLVKVIGSAMRDYEHMGEKALSFGDALTALATGKPTEIAQAAGKIEDGQLRTLMLECLRNPDEAFRSRLSEMVAAQLGVVQRNAAACRRLALQTMPQLAAYKVQHERLMAMHRAYDLAEPLLLVDEHLRQAQAYLELPMREHQQLRAMPVALIEAE